MIATKSYPRWIRLRVGGRSRGRSSKGGRSRLRGSRIMILFMRLLIDCIDIN